MPIHSRKDGNGDTHLLPSGRKGILALKASAP